MDNGFWDLSVWCSEWSKGKHMRAGVTGSVTPSNFFKHLIAWLRHHGMNRPHSVLRQSLQKSGSFAMRVQILSQ
jgi:hypothetical protein